MKITKKEKLFLNGIIKLDNEQVGPFSVELSFDRFRPGYKHKKGILYSLAGENLRQQMRNLFRIWTPGKELIFYAKSNNAIIELKNFRPSSLPHPDSIPKEQDEQIKRISEFTFDTFTEKEFNIDKEMIPKRIIFYLEDLVLFRPTLKGTSTLLGNKGESKELKVNLEEFDNCLKFEIDDLSFETHCSISAPVTLRDRHHFSVSTHPLLLIEQELDKLSKDDLIEAGENLLLLLSVLEERFIKYIGTTVLYDAEADKRPLCEYSHTHQSQPMTEAFRPDLKARQPMDKLLHSDIKQMYIAFKRINHDYSINFAPILWQYINGIQANMIRYNITDLYSCIDKILDIYPKLNEDFHYVETKDEKGHRVKARQLCKVLKIEYEDLKVSDDPFRYIPIRHSYTHFKEKKKYDTQETWNATKMAGYLARRLILSLLGLDYRNFNSCDPQKRGNIGL